MIISPGLASAARPSTVKVTTSALMSVKRTRALLDVGEVLVSEHLDRGRDRRRDRWPQHADRRLGRRPRQAGGDVVAHVEEQVEVGHAPTPELDPPQHLVEPPTALTARGALAA